MATSEPAESAEQSAFIIRNQGLVFSQSVIRVPNRHSSIMRSILDKMRIFFWGVLYHDDPVRAIVENFAILSMDQAFCFFAVSLAAATAARCVGKTLTESPAFLTAQTPSER